MGSFAQAITDLCTAANALGDLQQTQTAFSSPDVDAELYHADAFTLEHWQSELFTLYYKTLCRQLCRRRRRRAETTAAYVHTQREVAHIAWGALKRIEAVALERYASEDTDCKARLLQSGIRAPFERPTASLLNAAWSAHLLRTFQAELSDIRTMCVEDGWILAKDVLWNDLLAFENVKKDLYMDDYHQLQQFVMHMADAFQTQALGNEHWNRQYSPDTDAQRAPSQFSMVPFGGAVRLVHKWLRQWAHLMVDWEPNEFPHDD